MSPMPPRMLDLIRMVQKGELPPPPIATLIGFTIRSIEPGHAVMEMEAGPQHANPMGTVHGGVLCDLADAAMGMAYASKRGIRSASKRARPLPRSSSRSTSSSPSGPGG